MLNDDSEKNFQKTVQKPWGKEVLYVPENLDRVGKILFIDANKRLSLQIHSEKEETLCLFSGKALLWLGKDKNSLEKIDMATYSGYTVEPGTIHRIESLENSVILEVSSPEKGTTFRIEDDFNRPDETEQLRAQPNRGWNN